jgi:hypothetical protein
MADETTLDHVQQVITDEYLGKAGIHGVGIRRKKSAIVLYIEPGASEKYESTMTKIKEKVDPLDLMIVEEEPPSIT